MSSLIEDYEFKSPITEQSNDITKYIDLACTEEIINLFSKTDNQIFNGWQVNEKTKSFGLNDESLLQNILKISEIIRYGLEDKTKKFKLIISGCGTSGRLAYICAQSLNEQLNREVATYLLAGYDNALINSVESIEDSPSHGIKDLKRVLDKNDYCVLIAITCGLSAPFVAGQLYHFLNDNTKLMACGLIGFNTIKLARNINLAYKHDSFTFSSILNECLKKKNFFLLNPIIGPEPITGSTRMKSGTATKIILDLIVTHAITSYDLKSSLRLHEEAIKYCIYENETLVDKLTKIIDNCSNFLCKSLNNSICYLSNDKKTSILCCIDASECVPTFGAERNQIKGLFNESKSSSTYDWWSAIDQFDECKYREIDFDGKSSTIFVEINKNAEKSHNSSESLDSLMVFFDQFVEKSNNEILKNEYFNSNLKLTLVKLCLNMISTGIFIKYGKVYFNYMIDVKTSNIKLYLRAINIISLLSNQNRHKCEICLLKSIYETNNINESDFLKEEMISKHVEKSTNAKNLVPKALIMCVTDCSYDEACKQLLNCPTVRLCIDKLLKK